MINLTKIRNGFIQEMVFENNSLLIHIDVKSFFTVKSLFGTVYDWSYYLERYRKLKLQGKLSDANNLISGKDKIQSESLKKIEYPFKNFHPDYIQVFNPRDKTLSANLSKFITRLQIEEYLLKFNFSNNFYKLDSDKSVVGKKETELDNLFYYNKPDDLECISNLLIIDDTIDQGRTINQFLKKLQESNLITSDTVIKVIIIYNNFKKDI